MTDTTESLRGMERLLRAEGSKASCQYEEMGGFPGSGYASRLGLTMLKGADALASALARLEAAGRTAREGVAEVEADERHHYKPALVEINAPLALIQVILEARKQAFQEVLAALAREEAPNAG